MKFSVPTYDEFLSGIIALGDSVQMLMQTIIIAFGALIGLVLLGVVEHMGISRGLQWFLTNNLAASFAALSLIIFNMIVEIMIVHIENAHKYARQSQTVWSLRLIGGSLLYRLGVNPSKEKRWKPRRRSPASRFYQFRALTTIAIFTLALAGRMQSSIRQVSEQPTVDDPSGIESIPLSEGIQKLLTESSLEDIFIWAGGTIFTIVAVFGVQGLTNYGAVRVIEIRAAVEKRERKAKAQRTRERNRQEKRLSTQTDNRQTGYGYSRNSSAVDTALEYLKANPNALSMSVREIGEAAGVGKDSAAKARRLYQTEKPSTNGHHSE